MEVFMDANECWQIRGESTNSDYENAVIENLGILYPLFCRAQEASQFDYIHTLLGIRSLEDAGWNPFKTTLRIIRNMTDVCHGQIHYELQANLGLWIYGHIIEASEPYEIIMNLLTIIDGGRFQFTCFPSEINKKGKAIPIYPWKKQEQIYEKAESLGISRLDELYNSFFDGRLRNAVFHSDYSIHGGEVRTMSPLHSYSREETWRLINHALAYLECIDHLVKAGLRFYEESVVIPAPKGFSADPEAKVRVIVREGEGAVGLMTELTEEQEAAGYIRAKLIRYYPEEVDLIKCHAHTLPTRQTEDVKVITKIYEFLKDEIMKHLDKLSLEREAKIVVTLLSLGYNPDKIYTVLSEKSPNMPRASDKERDYKKKFLRIVKNYNEKGENGGADPNERLLEGLLCSLGHARPDHDEYLRWLIAQMYTERKVLEAIKRLEDLDDAVRDELYRKMEETFRLLREDSEQRIKSMKNKGLKRT